MLALSISLKEITSDATNLSYSSYVDAYRNMAVSQSKGDLKRQMKRFAGMKLRNLNDPNAGEPDSVTFIRNEKPTLSIIDFKSLYVTTLITLEPIVQHANRVCHICSCT